MRIKPKQFDDAGASNGDALVWNATLNQWIPQASTFSADVANYLDRFHARFDTLVIGSAAANTYTDHFSQLVALNNIGLYKISTTLFHSMNLDSVDFLAELRVNGVMIHATRVHVEPKDVAGSDGGDGTGTDQKIPVTILGSFNNTTAQTVTISLAFAASGLSAIPAIRSSELFVERFL